MRVAIVLNNTVDNVVDAGSVETMRQKYPLPSGYSYIDGTRLSPGDVKDPATGIFHSPAAASALPDILTPEQLRLCFPNGEFQSLVAMIRGDDVAEAFIMDAQMRTDNGINRRDARFIAGVQYFLSKGYLSSAKAAYLTS